MHRPATALPKLADVIHRTHTRRTFGVALLGACAGGCTTLQEIAALREVDFALDRVTNLRLAGSDLSGVRRASDLSLAAGARVAAAFASRELPLSFQLHVRAENPSGNGVTARLMRMRWTMFLEDRETVSGSIGREFALAPGQPTDIPLDISLDLLEFYERSAADLIELALNLAGAGGEPKNVRLSAVPTIETPLGAISYPRPITIVSGSLGSPNAA